MTLEKDYTTINQDELNKLPMYHKPPSYSLGSEGNGCFLDPPGYPTYFTRSVYNYKGDSPREGAQRVLLGHVVESADDWEGVDTWEEYRQRIDKRIKRLYIPLPLDHPRTRAWIMEVYKHLQHCYYDETIQGNDKTIIFPVPDWKLKSFTDDIRFSDEWQAREKSVVEQANSEIIAHATAIATPENHQAVRYIRKYYPEYQPELDLIANPPSLGNWWERYATKPTPEECPGEYSQRHPVNGSWCQMCGWNGEEVKA